MRAEPSCCVFYLLVCVFVCMCVRAECTPNYWVMGCIYLLSSPYGSIRLMVDEKKDYDDIQYTKQWKNIRIREKEEECKSIFDGLFHRYFRSPILLFSFFQFLLHDALCMTSPIRDQRVIPAGKEVASF